MFTSLFNSNKILGLVLVRNILIHKGKLLKFKTLNLKLRIFKGIKIDDSKITKVLIRTNSKVSKIRTNQIAKIDLKIATFNASLTNVTNRILKISHSKTLKTHTKLLWLILLLIHLKLYKM